MDWIAEHWIALGTLLAVTIGAVAALWTARETRRLAALQQKAMGYPDPAIIATCKFYPTRPDVADLRIQIRNLANVGMETIAIRSKRLSGIRIRPTISTGAGESEGESKGSDPESWPRRISANFALNAVGSTSKTEIYLMGTIHVRRLPGCAALPLVIILDMRWRDHAVTRFSRAVTVTPSKIK